EGIAGVKAAVEYLTDLGRNVVPGTSSRRKALEAAYAAIAEYERGLGQRLLAGLTSLKHLHVLGITDATPLEERVPTISFIPGRRSPRAVAEHLDRHDIFVWHGNFYALELSEALGLEPEGMVRIGLLHYNTSAEVDRSLAALADLDRK